MKRWVLAAALVLPIGQAEAAVLYGSSNVGGWTEGGVRVTDESSPPSVTTGGGISTFQSSASIDLDGMVGSAASRANVETGEFSAGASITGHDPTRTSLVNSRLEVREGFSVEGAGIVRFTLDLLGREEVSMLPQFGVGTQLRATLSARPLGGLRTYDE